MVHLLKEREESAELKLMRHLNGRMTFTEDQLGKYLSMEKGFIGEKKFDQLTGNLNGDWLVLNDLLVEYGGRKCQIDSLLLSQYTLFQFEVKNFEGDYYLDGKRFYLFSGKEVNSPLLQLEKNETILRQIIQDSIMPNLKIQSYLIFIHPEFTLYQTPSSLSKIIFPTQLNRFMKKLDLQHTKSSQKHFKFAENLLSMHFSEDPWKYVPEYDYDSLQKRVICPCCMDKIVSQMYMLSRSNLVCERCGWVEKTDDTIMRQVEEIQLLFPEKNITTNLVYEWCGRVISERTVRRVLSSNLKRVRRSNYSYYID